MRNKIKVTFLGTAANGGIPQIDCHCQNCSNFNGGKRSRSSILIRINNRKIIIDCGPDFRQQLLKQNLRLMDIDAIVLTHLHWDHCLGLLELTSGKPLEVPIVVPSILMKNLRDHQLFGFIFKSKFAKFQNKIQGTRVEFIEVPHDPNFPAFAVKLKIDTKNIIITPDISSITKKLNREMKKASLVVFDGTFLKENKHGHISIKESASILSMLGKKVIFTHINHSENKRKIISFLKKFKFRLAFDGMFVKV